MPTKTFPTLYKKTKTGKIQQWTISVSETGAGYGEVTVSHGQTTGKIQTNVKLITSGKNVGKTNETTPFQQALSESSSAWKKRVDAGYTEDTSGVSSVVLPMLAKTYVEKTGGSLFPCYSQPKLNGVRCLALRRDGRICLLSRKGKEYTKALPHITQALERVLDDKTIFDGELYVYGWSFQRIVRAVKKQNLKDSHKIQYWVYDLADSGSMFIDRKELIKPYSKHLSTRVFKFVPSTMVFNHDQMQLNHLKLIKQGFEGIILRTTNGYYEFNTRSDTLWKYKNFHDKEVLIVGFKEGIGLELGCVVWHVRDEFGNLFWSRPKGTHDSRKKLYHEATKHIGKELIIRYQELSEDNVPVFNVGIAIRDYE